MATPTPFGGTPMYSIPEENRSQTYDVPQQIEGLPDMKPEDQQYFGALLKVRKTLPSLACACISTWACRAAQGSPTVRRTNAALHRTVQQPHVRWLLRRSAQVVEGA
jgi:hypothetical protein